LNFSSNSHNVSIFSISSKNGEYCKSGEDVGVTIGIVAAEQSAATRAFLGSCEIL